MKKGSVRQQRRKFSKEFKQRIVKLFVDGQSAVSIAADYDLTDNLIYRWKKELTAQENPESDSSPKELDSLRKELRKVEEERDILKKALAICNRFR